MTVVATAGPRRIDGRMRGIQGDKNWALFLDLDGTLFELAPTPDEVLPDPRLSALLKELVAVFDGAVAIVSGRALSDIDRLLPLHEFPAAGLHGLERRQVSGAVEELQVDLEALSAVRDHLHSFTQSHPDLLLEDKGKALGMHYRQAPHLAQEVLDVTKKAVAPYSKTLGLQPGKMVVEVKPHGANKGSAIAAFMEEPPFSGRRPLMAGDDITDEDAFALARSFGGSAIRIGQPSRTLAHERLDTVQDFRKWLQVLAAETSLT
ncbi:trehalose 6-phosphate phosphatase [Rhodoligotrophos appendicifer]|uniref:trehalose-phosphatase n=1 Tax=Rhodoligotrophos appendicifer TaxID=987056 RepID=UPI0011855C17|nr:trehalose-phosphatase [Rhodoligotrophos appendicifer]